VWVVVVAAARLWFAYASNHGIRVPVGTWMFAHQLTSSALVDAFTFLALATVLTRTGSLAVRSRALRGAAPALPGSPQTSREARRWQRTAGGLAGTRPSQLEKDVMASDAKTRASDADRDRTAALHEHLAAGRLTIEESDERLDQAYAAKTLGELNVLMADLPQADLVQVTKSSPPGSAASPPLARLGSPGSIQAGQGRFSPAWRAAWGSWLAVSVFFS
jgi:hypothetical protein